MARTLEEYKDYNELLALKIRNAELSHQIKVAEGQQSISETPGMPDPTLDTTPVDQQGVTMPTDLGTTGFESPDYVAPPPEPEYTPPPDIATGQSLEIPAEPSLPPGPQPPSMVPEPAVSENTMTPDVMPESMQPAPPERYTGDAESENYMELGMDWNPAHRDAERDKKGNELQVRMKETGLSARELAWQDANIPYEETQNWFDKTKQKYAKDPWRRAMDLSEAELDQVHYEEATHEANERKTKSTGEFDAQRTAVQGIEDNAPPDMPGDRTADTEMRAQDPDVELDLERAAEPAQEFAQLEEEYQQSLIGHEEAFNEVREPLPELSDAEFAGQKFSEMGETIKEASTSIWENRSKLAEEIPGDLLGDAPLFVLGYGALSAAKMGVRAGQVALMNKAMKMGMSTKQLRRVAETRKALKTLSVEERTAVLTRAIGPEFATISPELVHTLPSVAKKMVAMSKYRFAAEYPALAKGAKGLAELGIFLSPTMISEEKIPEIEEIVATAGVLAGIKIIGHQIKRHKSKIKPSKDLSTDVRTPKKGPGSSGVGDASPVAPELLPFDDVQKGLVNKRGMTPEGMPAGKRGPLPEYAKVQEGIIQNTPNVPTWPAAPKGKKKRLTKLEKLKQELQILQDEGYDALPESIKGQHLPESYPEVYQTQILTLEDKIRALEAKAPKSETPAWVNEGVAEAAAAEEKAGVEAMAERDATAAIESWEAKFEIFGPDVALAKKMVNFLKWQEGGKGKKSGELFSEHISKDVFGTATDELAANMTDRNLAMGGGKTYDANDIAEILSGIGNKPKPYKKSTEIKDTGPGEYDDVMAGKKPLIDRTNWGEDLPKPAVSNKYVANLKPTEIHDSGLANKKHWEDEMLPQALNDGDYVMMYDIDFFKPANDKFGHGGADVARNQSAAFFAKSFPEGKLANPGGDEFGGILREMPSPARLKQFIEDHPKYVVMEGQGITISAGIAKGKTGRNLNADNIAGIAKKEGRNQLATVIDGKKVYYKGKEVYQPYVTEYQSEEFVRLAKDLEKKSEELSPEIRGAVARALQGIRKTGKASVRRDPGAVEGLPGKSGEVKAGKKPLDNDIVAAYDPINDTINLSRIGSLPADSPLKPYEGLDVDVPASLEEQLMLHKDTAWAEASKASLNYKAEITSLLAGKPTATNYIKKLSEPSKKSFEGMNLEALRERISQIDLFDDVIMTGRRGTKALKADYIKTLNDFYVKNPQLVSKDGKIQSQMYHYLKKGEKGAWDYLRSFGSIGEPSKAKNAMNGTLLVCTPTKDCAIFCYASKGNYLYGTSQSKSELIDFMVNKNPEKMGRLAASEYSIYPEFQAKKALRIFDKGDLSPAWVKAIKTMNDKKVQVQVFSKKPDLLAQLHPDNIRMLSVDNSTFTVPGGDYTIGNDLPIAFVYGGREDLVFLKRMGPKRVQVVLPVKSGKKTLDDAEIAFLRKWMADNGWEDIAATYKVLCPVDAGLVKLPAKKNAPGWTCTQCDIDQGIGCFRTELPEKANFFEDLVSKKIIIKDTRETIKYGKIALTPEQLAQILDRVPNLIKQVQSGTLPEADVNKPGDKMAGGGEQDSGTVRAKGKQLDAFGEKGHTASSGLIGKGKKDKGLEGTPLFDSADAAETALLKKDQTDMFGEKKQLDLFDPAAPPKKIIPNKVYVVADNTAKPTGKDIKAIPVKNQPMVDQRGNAKTQKQLKKMSGRLDYDKAIQEMGLAENERVAWEGLDITDPNALLPVVDILRNPLYETFRIFFLKDGKVLRYKAYSSRMPASAKSKPGETWKDTRFVQDIKDVMKRLGADKIMMQHNHPLGDVTPSKADFDVTSWYRHMFGDKLYGHIVTNHSKYIEITPKINLYGDKVFSYVEREMGPWDKGVDPFKYKPNMKLVKSVGDLLHYAKSVSNLKDQIGLIIRNSNGHISGVTSVHKNTLLKDDSSKIMNKGTKHLSSKFDRTINNIMANNGGAEIFAFIENDPVLSKAMMDTKLFEDVYVGKVSQADVMKAQGLEYEQKDLSQKLQSVRADKKPLDPDKSEPGQQNMNFDGAPPEGEPVDMSSPNAVIKAYKKAKDFMKGNHSRLPKELTIIYDNWVKQTQVRNFRLARTINLLRQGTTKPQRELATFLREKTGVPDNMDRQDLQKLFDDPEQQIISQRLADIAGKIYDDFQGYLTDNLDNVPAKWIENYVNHAWDIPKSKLGKVIKWFSTRNPNLNKRTIATIKEGIEKFDLKPKTLDISELLSIYGQNAINTTENTVFLKGLEALEDASGVKLILPTSQAPNDWKSIDHPALNKYTYMGEGKKTQKFKGLKQTIVKTIEKIRTIQTSSASVKKDVSKPIQKLESVIVNALESRGMTSNEAGNYLGRLKAVYAGADVSADADKVTDTITKKVETLAQNIEEEIEVSFPLMEKKAMKFHPDLAPVMEAIFQAPFDPGGKAGAIIFAWENLNALYKQTNLMASLFHHIALGEGAVAAMGVKKALGVALNFKAMKEALFDGKFAMFMDKWEIAQDAVEAGLMLGASMDIQKALVDKMIEETGKFADKLPVEYKGIKGGSAFRGLGWAKDKWDMALWDYYHNNLKLMAYEHLVNKELTRWADNVTLKEQFGKSFLLGPAAKKQMATGIQNITPQQTKALKTEIAIFVNDTFGGQNLKAKMTSPSTMRVLRALMLSPDWLNSTMRQAASVFGYGAKDPEFIGMKMRMGAKFWTRAAIYFGGGVMMWNYMMSKRDDAEEKGIPWTEGLVDLESVIKDAADHVAQDPGHETHMLWFRNDEGQKVYLRQGKQFRESPEFVLDAQAGEVSPITASLKKLGGKASPAVHMLSATATGKTASGYEVKELRDVTGNQKAWALTKYLSTSWMPFSFSALRDEEKEFSPIQFILPTSKGMTNSKTQKYFKWAIMKGDAKRVRRIYKAAKENNLTDIESTFVRALGDARAAANEELIRDLKRNSVTVEQIQALNTKSELQYASKVLASKLAKYKKLELHRDKSFVNETIRAWMIKEKILDRKGLTPEEDTKYEQDVSRIKATLIKKSLELQEYMKD